jgi:hypothetical protein
MTKSLSRNIRKKTEFLAFLKILKGSAVQAHWIETADALGVNKDTITEWKKLPEAIKARQEGISEAIAKMEKAGAHDWRMWEAKLKMLGIGINNTNSVNVQVNNQTDRTEEIAESMKAIANRLRV